jgi:hypothetical protein
MQYGVYGGHALDSASIVFHLAWRQWTSIFREKFERHPRLMHAIEIFGIATTCAALSIMAILIIGRCAITPRTTFLPTEFRLKILIVMRHSAPLAGLGNRDRVF